MKKILITGASGFVGGYLLQAIDHKQWQVHGTIYEQPSPAAKTHLPPNQTHQLNLLDQTATNKVVHTVKPDAVIHLAALSSAAFSHKQPQQVITNNITAQVNLLEALIQLDTLPTTLIIGSAEEYGLVKAGMNPVTESTPLNPLNPYAVSKIAQDFSGLQYFHTHKLPVIRFRPFNHTGAGRPDSFVLSAFASQVAKIEAGLQDPVISVGNLKPIRDFTHVKDIVRAYLLSLDHATPGEVYNLGSGTGTQIKTLLDMLLQQATVEIEVKTDKSRYRPADVPKLIADISKFNQATNWQPEIDLEAIVADVLDYWRQKIEK